MRETNDEIANKMMKMENYSLDELKYTTFSYSFFPKFK